MPKMPIRTSFLCTLLLFLTVLMEDSGCGGYQLRSSFSPLNSSPPQDRHHLKEEEDLLLPKVEADLLESLDDSADHSRQREERDSSSADDEASVALSIPLSRPSPPQKRRRGPTLSVVNPLEILRQRLMLDLARRRIHENQQQIVANAQLLENIGKRSTSQRRSPRGYRP